MRGRSVPKAMDRTARASGTTRDSSLERAFRRFQQAASDFSGVLNSYADFRSDVNGSAAAQINLQVARSIFGKWSFDILVLLVAERHLGFAELRKTLRGISARILSAKLKQLEGQGLVHREVLATRPPRVNYGLTERGLMVTRLEEPVLLYLRFVEGLYLEPNGGPAVGGVETPASPAAGPVPRAMGPT